MQVGELDWAIVKNVCPVVTFIPNVNPIAQHLDELRERLICIYHAYDYYCQVFTVNIHVLSCIN